MTAELPGPPQQAASSLANGPAQTAETSALPPLEELLASVRIVAIPTRTRFRGISVREAAIFEGPNGASEFSPFLEYADAEAASWLAAAIEYGWGELPSLLRTSVAINATVPAVTVAEVPEVLARFEGCTTAKVKVAERGQTLENDISRVRAVRAAMGDDALVRIDANGGWTIDEAVTALQALAEFGLDYAEQPCMTVPELVEVRRRLTQKDASAASEFTSPGHEFTTADQQKARGRDDGVAASPAGLHASQPSGWPESETATSEIERQHNSPLVRIAADESVRKAEDPLAVARSGAADLLIVKAQPLGGIARALNIIEAAGLPVVVSSALDTSVGISMGLHLAAALPDYSAESGTGLAGACGLGTAALLAGDVVGDPLLAQHGAIEVRRPELDHELLARYAAAPEREQWWRERIIRCHALLA